jgi:ABC-2 type transport system permease protein
MAAYLAVATAFGTALALQSAHPRLALIGLFAIWISVVLVLPRLVSSAIDAARPLPSSQAVRQEILDQAPAYWSVEEGNRQKAALLKLHGVTRLEDIANPRMAELDMVEKHSHQVFDRVLGKFYAQVFGQDALFSWAGFLSPAIAVQALSASVAGTDFSHHHHFIRAAELHRRDLVNRMNADGMAHRAHGDERHLNDRRLWSQIAPFSYREPSLTDAGWVVTPSIVALLLWLLAGMLLLGHVARRLKP